MTPVPLLSWLANVPVAILAWLANLVFLGIPVMIVFTTDLSLLPRTFAVALLESHKIILIGAVTLAGVAVVETIYLSQKFPQATQFYLIGVFFLFFTMFAGFLLFQNALAQDEDFQINFSFCAQVALGFILLVFASALAITFKYAEEQESKHAERQEGQT
jgi:hypothetical protein